MRKHIFIAGFLLMVSAGVFAQKSPVFNPSEGAIRGYDPVAYFKDGKAVKGSQQFSYTWQTAVWYFSSRQNLDSFQTAPEKFAPRYGGYCAYGLADGHKAPTDPEAWAIVDNRLYLNYNKKVQELWKKNQEKFIEKADSNWQLLKNKE
jgi:YHS domain-containing protein